MKRILRYSRIPILASVAAVALAAPAAVPAIAQAPGAMPGMMAPGQPGMAQVLLTEDQVVGFIESFPRLRALGDKYDARADAQRESANPASALAGMLANENAMREMKGILAEHGFSGFDEWMQVATAIIFAHQWKDDGKDPASQMDKAIAKIQDNKQLGEAQKAALIGQIEAQRGMLAALRPHPDNIALVRRHGEQIENAIKRHDETK